MSVEVCLISPVSRAGSGNTPLGLLYVASYLKKYGGITPKVIDLKVNFYDPLGGPLSENSSRRLENMMLEKIKQAEPAVVGITCLVTEVKEVLDLSKAIKENMPDTVIVVGGIHPTMYPGDLLFEDSYVDYVVIGEGEITFTELVRALDNGADVRDVCGLAWFDGGSVQKSRPRFSIEDLDTIPFPLYEGIDSNCYFRPSINIIRNMLLSTARIFTSRGCPSQCTFCVNKNLHRIMGARQPFRQRSVKNVVDEIAYLADTYSIDGFYLCDDAFCVKKDFTLGFCEELMRRDLGLIWATETKVSFISPEIVKAMRKAGCVQLDFGVESGSPDILSKMKKGITVEQIKNAFRWCHQAGVRPLANFMFNTPGETEEDVNRTLGLAKEINACYYAFNLMVPFPGTDIYEEVQPKLTVAEYGLFSKAYYTLPEPRFKFAAHCLDLDKLVWRANVSFNSLWRRAAFLFSRPYLKRVFKSKRKQEYFLMLLEAFKKIAQYYGAHLRFIFRCLCKTNKRR